MQLRQTRYEVVAAAGVRIGDPAVGRFAGPLGSPPAPAAVIVDCEQRVFAD